MIRPEGRRHERKGWEAALEWSLPLVRQPDYGRPARGMREQDGPDHPLTHTHAAGARIPDGSGAVVDIGRGISDGIADRHGKSVVVDTVPASSSAWRTNGWPITAMKVRATN